MLSSSNRVSSYAMDLPVSATNLDDDLLKRIFEATIASTAKQGPLVSTLRLVSQGAGTRLLHRAGFSQIFDARPLYMQVCKYWCQVAGRCNLRMDFYGFFNLGVSRNGQLGTLLARSFSGVSQIHIRGGQSFAEDLDSLGQLPHLTRLSFFNHRGPGITAAHFTKLRSLTLHNVYNMSANWLPHSVPHLQGLTELVLEGYTYSISGADLGSLSKLSALKALWLERQDYVQLQDACSSLSHLTLLTRLRIKPSLVSNKDLTGLKVCTS